VLGYARAQFACQRSHHEFNQVIPITVFAALHARPSMSVRSSVRWLACAQATRIGAQLISLFVLARLLPPQAYGLIAMAMTVTNLAFMFRDLGTMVAVVQRPQLSERLASTLYWVNFGLALFIGLSLFALARPIASGYGEPRLAPIICALAITIPISSVASVQQALMERHSQFRVLARIEAVSAAAGVALAVLIALRGGKEWSLVCQMLLSTTLAALQSWFASPWRPRRLFDRAELRSVFGFSGHYSLYQFITYLLRNGDSVIVGKMLGSSVLGVYSMASKVMLFPLQNITTVVNRALLPAMSRRQQSRQELRRLFLRAIGAVSMITAPLMAGLYALREPFVAAAFGPHWMGAAQLLAWLAAVGFLQSISAPHNAVLLALGKTRLMLLLSLYAAAVHLSCLTAGAHWGVQGVAVGYLIANVLVIAPLALGVKIALALPLASLLGAIGKPVAAALLMVIALRASQQMFDEASMQPVAICIVNAAIGALAYAFVLFVALRQDASTMRALFNLREA
jgi:PST family polysaccharide transporter